MTDKYHELDAKFGKEKPLGNRGPVNHGAEMKEAEDDFGHIFPDLEKMHADDDALSVKDAERFDEDQRASAFATLKDYMDKHPSPHAHRDKTEEWDMDERNQRIKDSKKKIAPNHKGEPDVRIPATRSGSSPPDFMSDIPSEDFEQSQKHVEEVHRIMDGGCVQEGFPSGHPWDDHTTPPLPPAMPGPAFTDEDREKMKDTLEKMGQGADGGGFRMNAGKNQIELLPEIWLWAIADVMTQGARKYPERNWEKGMDWSAMIGCMYRHLMKFQSGQRYDGKEFNKELGTTGCHELAMVAWNALALMFYDIYGLGTNDLPVYEDLDHFIRVNGSNSDLALRWAKEEVNGND